MDYLNRIQHSAAYNKRTSVTRTDTISEFKKGWKKVFQENCHKKQAGVAILISNKIVFQPKVIK